MTVFGDYAEYYDLFYKDKTYRAEAEYVSNVIRAIKPDAYSLLELGCGTGNYCREFVELGYSVLGIDRSPQMITQAEGFLFGLSQPPVRPHYQLGDIRDCRCGTRFDVVTSLFHVISYQTTNEDLIATFQTAREHLHAGGLFLFDCWNGPGVLSDPPKNPLKTVRSDQIAATRRTTSTLLPDKNIVNVHFNFEITNSGSGNTTLLTEEHQMRYFFPNEISDFAAMTDMQVLKRYKWLTEDEPDETAWYTLLVLGAI
jgi:SAM-dependent methyltransferase